MIDQWPLLSLLIATPLVGAFFVLVTQGNEDVVARNAKNTALFSSLVTFILSLLVWGRFDGALYQFQMVEYIPWMQDFDIAYHIGVDGISLPFVLLSTFLTPLCILASWNSITERVKEFMIAFLVLEAFMIGMFVALDFVLFYVFFEAVLIPMFLIIGIWGGSNRVYAAFKFFLYTFLGSVLMLVALVAVYLIMGTSDIPTLLNSNFPQKLQFWVWIALFASFAVKIPMWPVHTWLPDAHVEAPTAGSVILAGVLLKMGGYGFLRFSIPMLPDATLFFTPLVYFLSIVAIIYTSLVALAQHDMKKLIAYSSIAHMGFVTLGIFTLTVQGVEGAIFQMVSHGIVSAALFLIVGVVYDRLHTREIARYSGLVNNMPKYAIVFMVMMLGAVGLPGTSGFVGEFLVLVGTWKASPMVAVFAASGVVLGATYMLLLYRRVVFGELVQDDNARMPDLNKREIAIFAPLVIAVLVLGIYPSVMMSKVSVSVQNLVQNHEFAHSDTEDMSKPVIFRVEKETKKQDQFHPPDVIEDDGTDPTLELEESP